MTEKERWQVATAMRKYGGSFASALGQALLLADPENASIIKQAFSTLWDRYTAIYEQQKRSGRYFCP